MLDEFSARTYSQNDEDGVIAEILARCHIRPPALAVEIGAGDGSENNTRLLREQGWRCVWIDPKLDHAPPDNIKEFVTAENVVDVVESAVGVGNLSAIDLFSLDIDGNDYWILWSLLYMGLRPSVVIAEYNGLLPPQSHLTITYDPNHVWDRTGYYGASLGAFHGLLGDRGYSLVHTNGINAFWVSRHHAHNFTTHTPKTAFRIHPVKPSRQSNWFTPRIADFVEV
jgi:hypothetical protein